ncbi:hypothetical protein L6452_32352 [Arctium lappa]|uniref:Uncharacterized protein n=1 Tax=Arctium lappa TaxID=4217 RepID=A0ACB8Z5H1_ARCLA|nr:hypothetical protein L6452_32352 [Arctium lappa]
MSYKRYCISGYILDLFDVKQKGVTDFGDFVRALNVMDGTGFIERQEKIKVSKVKLVFRNLCCEGDVAGAE